MSRHIRRTVILRTLSEATLALLCPCDDCHQVVLNGFDERSERTRRNRHLHPLCDFCLSPMVWREVAFVCPYRESQELHEEIRRLNTPHLRNRSKVAVETPVEGGWPLQ